MGNRQNLLLAYCVVVLLVIFVESFVERFLHEGLL